MVCLIVFCLTLQHVLKCFRTCWYSGTVPGTVPGAVLGTVPGAVPGTVPGTVPGAVSSTKGRNAGSHTQVDARNAIIRIAPSPGQPDDSANTHFFNGNQ